LYVTNNNDRASRTCHFVYTTSTAAVQGIMTLRTTPNGRQTSTRKVTAANYTQLMQTSTLWTGRWRRHELLTRSSASNTKLWSF